ncbi:hypothetical protein B0H17DRAFT_1208878 [Mycena rosella]|uniref:Uncharacterized protein n=1 Tax=Mycena rosella TaxID=1033263 RepID=A0AAD7D071_MYCRO|nr:hypothetical protein B0H17DRAFT_1208878 [Mycena rosella]
MDAPENPPFDSESKPVHLPKLAPHLFREPKQRGPRHRTTRGKSRLSLTAEISAVEQSLATITVKAQLAASAPSEGARTRQVHRANSEAARADHAEVMSRCQRMRAERAETDVKHERDRAELNITYERTRAERDTAYERGRVERAEERAEHAEAELRSLEDAHAERAEEALRSLALGRDGAGNGSSGASIPNPATDVSNTITERRDTKTKCTKS